MKTLGVLGGMGPLATVDFLKKLVTSTDAKRDRDHIHTFIDSNCEIPDRTDYIINDLPIENSPLTSLLSSVKRLERLGVSAIVMPCNTAHYFAKEIEDHIDIPFINMIEETAKDLVDEDTVGLLATKGTYRAKIYSSTFKNYDISISYPPYELMLKVNKVIYMLKEGVCENNNECRALLDEVFCHYREMGIKKVILGCTELPLLFNGQHIEDIELIDPTEILALSAIRYMGKNIRR